VSAPEARSDPGSGFAPRFAAALVLRQVLGEHRQLDAAVDAETGEPVFLALEPRERALARAIVATVLRRRGQIADALKRLMERPPPRRSGLLPEILATAAAQILFMNVPDHAAVSVAVSLAAADPDAQHFKGLVNGVLRALARSRDAILADQDAAWLSTPNWLWERWAAEYREAGARQIAEAHLAEPPLDITVRSNPAGWAERLGGLVMPTGSIRLVLKGPVETLPGYDAGVWWVQDAGAALPARLLGPVAGRPVADLCAAPGGKTAQLAAAGAQVTAVDVSAARLQRLARNLSRLGLAAETVAADVTAWQPGRRFAAVLLDAPCSATGTIRRHPDVQHLKSAVDIAALSALQWRLLLRATELTEPGGTLVYCTCSLEREEGEDQVTRALAELPLEPLPVRPGELGGEKAFLAASGAVRTMPQHWPHPEPRLGGIGGFFIYRFRRR
jgi:16S rRNA (cytosine967-C5)-methyltransferase